MKTCSRSSSMVSRQAADEVPPYARLLQSAMAGDTSLFAREDLIEAQWRIVEPVLDNTTAALFLRARKLGTARGRLPACRGGRMAQPMSQRSRIVT